ncbi:MAG: YkuS family protein [bacterium]
MSERTVAVEDGLDNVKAHLSRYGYKVVDFAGGLHNADAVIISGIDQDFLGFTEPHTGVPVISVQGRSPKDVLTDLDRRI